MFLESLDLLNFKNLENVSLKFSNNINCFIGENGAGKTNILDAVHILSMCKSGFSHSDRQCVMHSKTSFLVSGYYKCSAGGYDSIKFSYKNSGKNFKRNDKDYQRLADHIGLIPLVMIAPHDSDIINESGEERRKFLNQFMSQMDRQYLNTILVYNQVLQQRNSLLKTMTPTSSREVLDIFDLQLSQAGTKIFELRKALVHRMLPLVQNFYSMLCGGKEKIEMEYQSKLNDAPFRELLRESFEKDCYNQFTTCGIHRDDIKMTIDGYPIRKFGSQGQQKSFLIALKLAQFEIIQRECAKTPILVLDDVFDKLDIKRVEGLINIVNGDRFGQIFISDCNKNRLNNILEKITNKYSIFNVDEGGVELCNDENQSL